VGAGTADEDEAVGVGVGELVGFTGQVVTVEVVGDGCVGGAGLDVTGVETGAVRPASGVTPVGIGALPVTTGSEEAAHPVLDVGCGAAVGVFREDVVVLPCPACALPEWVPPPVGGPLPLLVCVPLPSVSAPPRDGVPPPFCEVLDWRIAWRTG
jgi:hypothetical protein